MNKFYKVSFEQFSKDLMDCREKNAGIILADEIFESQNFQRYIYDAIKIPQRSTSGAAGYDFFAPFSFFLKPGQTIVIPTGIKVELDNDKWLAIVPRSGFGFKYRMQLDNTIGVIDEDYFYTDREGHIMAKFTNDSKVVKLPLISRIKKLFGMNYDDPNDKKIISVNVGQGMVQGIIQNFFKTDDDVSDAKRAGGLGSTDK